MYQNTLLFSFSVFIINLISSADADSKYDGCPLVNSSCGSISTISYPFWDGRKLPDYCGHPSFKIDCDSNTSATINIKNQTYEVLEIKYAAKVAIISRPQFSNDPCPPSRSMLTNTSLDSSVFVLTSNSQDAFLFYDCQPPNLSPNPPYGFSCSKQNSAYGSNTPSSTLFSSSLGYLATNNTTWEQELRKNCSFVVTIPILTTEALMLENSESNINQVLKSGFEVKWMIDDGQCDECMKSRGRCGFDQTLEQPTCFCKNDDHETTCNKPENTAHAYAPTSPTGEPKFRKIKPVVAIGAGIAIASGVLMSSILCFFLYRRRYKKNSSSLLLAHNKPYRHFSATSDLHILSGSTVFGVHVFNYRELEEATEYFNPLKELGEGGFGTVYYGKLRDGREVAIKRLYENNNKRAEQFINEVEILANLRHKNLVNLYGCTSRQSRELLLVYEYVPNGTVADHLHGKQSKHGLLPWATRLSIATETASALVYLHDSDIVHRDVKTQNILLDKNFSVKVADFGLSRLFPLDVTHVSTAPQGTPGYVDPEYHQCYQLTEKSDVYSFGVMLAELVSSLPAVDITRKRNEINLSNMAVNKIRNCLNEFVDPSLGFQSDCGVKQEITAVAELAFQCLQNTKEMRPTMNEVLKRLLVIHDQQGSEADSAEVVDISADYVLMLKGDQSPIVSPSREDPLVTRYKFNASV